MIKFFRKIRYDLMEKNKTGKYLKYAIGEIALVVIGILIALQINSWSNKNKNDNLEIEYLKGIKTNIISDISELEWHFEADTTKLNSYTFLIRALNSDSIVSNSQDLITNFYTSAGYSWFEGQNVVFEDMTSSGRLNLIQSDTLKYTIQKYYRLFKEVIKQEDLYNSEIKKYSDRNSQYIDVSSFIEPTFKAQWNGNTGPPSLAFMEKLNFIQVKQKMIDNFSLIKNNRLNSHNVRIQIYQKAISLKEMIERYLIEKK